MNLFNRPMMQPVQRRTVVATYFQELRVYPGQYCGRDDIEKGDKILLPVSALNQLYGMISSRSKSPMIFCIQNPLQGKLTYCGVLQFVAEEGNCYVPQWMFKMLKFIEPGTRGSVALVPDLKKSPKPSLVKLQPHLTKFIELPNPKAVLEMQLRNFTCLHVGDTIKIKTYSGEYEIDILQIKPKNDYDAICLIDADVEVDFAPPLDYEEPNLNKKSSQVVYGENQNGTKKFDVFNDGKGVRIDQKNDKGGLRKPSQQVTSQVQEYDPRKHRIKRGVRKTTNDFTGASTKVGDVPGLKKK